jgi:hypothetical protein
MMYDELLAVAAELISRATLSDAIQYGFSQVELSMLPSGRLGVSLGDRYATGTQAVAAAMAEARHALAIGPMPTADADRPAADAATRVRSFASRRASSAAASAVASSGYPIAIRSAIASTFLSCQQKPAQVHPTGPRRTPPATDDPGLFGGVKREPLGLVTMRHVSNGIRLGIAKKQVEDLVGPQGFPDS